MGAAVGAWGWPSVYSETGTRVDAAGAIAGLAATAPTKAATRTIEQRILNVSRIDLNSELTLQML